MDISVNFIIQTRVSLNVLFFKLRLLKEKYKASTFTVRKCQVITEFLLIFWWLTFPVFMCCLRAGGKLMC